jgi:hypothetical protein
MRSRTPSAWGDRDQNEVTTPSPGIKLDPSRYLQINGPVCPMTDLFRGFGLHVATTAGGDGEDALPNRISSKSQTTEE